MPHTDAPEAPYTNLDKKVASRFFAECYAELLHMARTRRRRAKFSDTLQSSDVLHEAYMKLCGVTAWQSRAHFMRTAALAIRQVIISHAREKLASKRGGGQPTLTLADEEPCLPEYQETAEQIAAIGDLLNRLESENARWAKIVDCRYFAGMTEDETAFALGVSSRTVRREWVLAKNWLAQRV
jgi:RNA polymerase sigma factor (TIGR02999 family)